MNPLELLCSTPQWLAIQWTPAVFQAFAYCFLAYSLIEIVKAAYSSAFNSN